MSIESAERVAIAKDWAQVQERAICGSEMEASAKGRAAGHAFRALELLYDEREAALAEVRRRRDPVERLAAGISPDAWEAARRPERDG